jgi:hypothetical protein
VEDVPGSAKGVCEACGSQVLKAELTPWPVSERRRTFVGRGAEGGGDNLFRYQDVARDYSLCPACRARVEAGEPFADIVGRRVRNQMIILGVVAVAILIGAVIFLPQLMSALWRTGGAGP